MHRTAGIRAFALAGLTVVCLWLCLGSSSPAGAAQVSIVSGKSTKIDRWPWQVALAVSKRIKPRAKPRARFFCGGALIAPDLVITAGHCVADLKPRQTRQIEVISGRTRLNNSSTGHVARVQKRMMPKDRRGNRLYYKRFGVADWDLALLRLSRSLPADTIRLAGTDEAAAWTPGRVVKTTGWGVTGPKKKKSSPVLRFASQVMLDDRVCQRLNGALYHPETMNCMGGPSANTSTCFGDSGGPLVAPLGGEYRLIGVTSFGDAGCEPGLPSIDTRIAANPIRAWVRKTALRVSGIDVVGSGGVAPPKKRWCRVPNLGGRTVVQARAALRARGCRLGRVRRDRFSDGRRGRVSGASLLPGWFTPLGRRVAVWVIR